MAYLAGSTFVGLNTNTDARRIKPNKDTEGIFESVEMTNLDLVGDGAMVTSKGFEAVSNVSGSGGVLNLLNYDKDTDNRWLLITYDDDHYSISPTDTDWSNTNLGDYGTVGTLVGGVVYKGTTDGTSIIRRAILGTDIDANTIQKVDISNAMEDVGGTPPTHGYIMAVFQGYLMVALGATLYITNAEDETDWATVGTVGFNDIITGISVDGERATVFTRSYHQGMRVYLDDANSLSVPLKEPYERPFGCLAHKTVVPTGSNTYYWSPRGIMRLGEEINYTSAVPRPRSLSKDIENSLENINTSQRAKATSVFWDEKRQYWMATPFGSENVNSICWIYWEDWNAWTTRDGFYPGDLELFRDSDYKNELYFGDANSPYLYKFNDDYSYDGAGYTRRWKSKIFTMGTGVQFKQFTRIDLTGSMDTGTEFFITLDVDGTKKKYKIDNTFLLRSSFSQYIGDHIYGNEWIGGDAPSESRFKRFYAPLEFPKEIREGMELQITIENDEPEQPFKIDFLGIEYNVLSRKQVPGRKFVNVQVST